MSDIYISELISRYLKGTISTQEKEILSTWLLENKEDEHLFTLLEQSWQKFEPNKSLPAGKANEIFRIISTQIQTSSGTTPARLISLSALNRKRLMIASSAMLILALSSYFIFFQGNIKSAEQKAIITQPVKNDIPAPQSVNAVLTLANGKTITLDSASKGMVATQSNTKVMKLNDGRIEYQSKGLAKELQYNLLTVPRGSKMAKIKLEDGTIVWLNAGSSLKYPVAFIGKERIVQMSGEAYFEVASNPVKPFLLRKMDDDIKVLVLGTHFNVNAYDDEANVKITLLEGAVTVSSSKNFGKLLPGQQAQVSNDIKILNDVDLDGVMAWKNGYFVMKGTDLPTLMRQIARWYDVDVVYENSIPKIKFGGSIGREVNLSTVLLALAENGVSCKLVGKKVFVNL